MSGDRLLNRSGRRDELAARIGPADANDIIRADSHPSVRQRGGLGKHRLCLIGLDHQGRKPVAAQEKGKPHPFSLASLTLA